MEADAGYCINKIAKKINTERRYCNEMCIRDSSRALLEADSEYRPALKAAGFLTRDPRMKERDVYKRQALR